MNITGGSATDQITYTGTTGTYLGTLTSIEKLSSAVALSFASSLLDGKTVDFSGAGNITITGMTGSETLTNVTSTGAGTLIANLTGSVNYTGSVSSDLVFNLSADSTALTGTAVQLTGKTVTDNANTTSVTITNLESTTTAQLQNIAGDTVSATWNGTAAFTGNLGSAAVNIQSGTLSATGSVIEGKCLSQIVRVISILPTGICCGMNFSYYFSEL